MYVATCPVPGGAPVPMVEYLRPIIGAQAARLWKTYPRIENGRITLPDTPGLPVEVDWDGLQARGAVKSVVDERA